MLFGEYLIDKKIISEEQLLEALLQQAELLPPIARIAKDKKILTAQQLLKILKVQSQYGKSFLDAASTFSFWNNDKKNDIEELVASLRTPLGELLVKRKVIELTTLTKALDDFFSTNENKQVKAEKIENKNTKIENNSAHVKEVSKQEEPVFDVQNYKQIFSYYNNEYMMSKKLIVEQLETNKLEKSQTLVVYRDQVKRILSASKLYEFNEFSEFLVKVEDIIQLIINKKIEKINADIVKKLKSVIVESDQVIQIAANLSSAGQLQIDSISNGECKEHAESALEWIELVKFDLSFID